MDTITIDGKTYKVFQKSTIIENEFEYKGYECIVCFMTIGGHRTGYVRLPINIYGNTNFYDLDCHGGITYNSYGDLFNEKNIYATIGMDCCHIEDHTDTVFRKMYVDELYQSHLITEIEHNKLMREAWIYYRGEIKSQEYVENELKHIVDQLLEIDTYHEKLSRIEGVI